MADEVVKVIKIEAQGSETTVKQLRAEISSLRDALLNTEKGSDTYNQAVEKLTATQNKLNEVMKAGKDAFVGRKQELRALKQELEQLVPGTAAYNEAFARAADITHQLSEQQEMLKYSAADLGTQMQNIVSIGSSLAAGFNSVNAIMALTGKKDEELMKSMQKLQAGIALVQGLQGLEGMTKRMKGLVAGMTEMIFKTTETTAAVGAETVSVEANTAAQEANATATAGATVATQAFSKALLATGIGAIIVLLGTLIANWDDLKETIGLTDEKLESFNGTMDKVKVALAGVGKALYEFFVAPLKTSIVAVSTLASATKELVKGHFKEAASIAKEGIGKISETYMKGFNFVTNYQEGAAKKSEQIQDKRHRQTMEALAEELNETIKDNEAKNGSDWKYSKEGQKLYNQMFDAKLKSLKKDSKEYREANRQKMAYDREFAEHNKKTSNQISNTAKETTDKMLEEAKKIEKRAEDSQKTELELAKEKYEKEYALLMDYGMDTTNLTKEYEEKVTAIKKKEEDKRRAEAEKTAAAEEKARRERAAAALGQTTSNLNALDDKNKATTTKITLEYSLKEAKESGSLSFNDIIAETNKLYEANKEYLEAQAAEYKALMESADADDEAKLDAKRDYYNTLTELDNLNTQNMIDNLNLQREAVEAQIEMYSDLAKSIGDIFGSIADIMEEDIKQKIKNGQITQEEGEKQFEAVKAFQIAQATINTIAGAIAAFMSCQSTYPQPYGAIIGAIQAAAVTAAGVAQIAKIKNTQLGGSGAVSSTMQASAAQPEPEEYVAPYTQNATGESEIVKLANSIRDQKVILVESDVTAAQEKAKRVRVESTW